MSVSTIHVRMAVHALIFREDLIVPVQTASKENYARMVILLIYINVNLMQDIYDLYGRYLSSIAVDDSLLPFLVWTRTHAPMTEALPLDHFDSFGKCITVISGNLLQFPGYITL